MKLSREEAWAGTLESMVDNRVVFYLRRYNRDYQDYSRQMKELCEKYPAIIQLIDGNMQIPLHRITDSASNGSVFPVVTEHFSASSDHAFL